MAAGARGGTVRFNAAYIREMSRLPGVAAECLGVARRGARVARGLAGSGPIAREIKAQGADGKLLGGSVFKGIRGGATYGATGTGVLYEEFGSPKKSQPGHRPLGRSISRL